MSNDLVERLRDADVMDESYVLAPLCHAAADEIERLRYRLAAKLLNEAAVPPMTEAELRRWLRLWLSELQEKAE